MSSTPLTSPPAPADKPTRYFIRDDDVGALTDELRFYVDTFLARDLPVSYQIIPERLTPACADYLVDLAKAHPNLIAFGQHGLRHQMTLRGKQLKREFGPERSFEQQSSDISEGIAILKDRLGPGTQIGVFTPPQHKFDRNTLLAVASAGYRIFSAANYSTPQHQLAYAAGRKLGLSSVRHHGISHHGRERPEAAMFELSIAVAIDNGRRIVTRAARLADQIRKSSHQSDLVGMMFHHDIYKDASDRAELELIADQISRLGTEVVCAMEDLAPRAAVSE